MRTRIILTISFLLLCNVAQASKFSEFLKSCGYGALAGAGAGVLTLLLENKPNEHYSNVARGASLGLYGGIAYGFYEMNKKPEYNYHQDYDPTSQTMIVPRFYQAKVDGIEVNTTVLNF